VYFKVNTGLTQKIFDWYLAHPTAKKFIQFSTVKSAADRVEGDFLTEECIPMPVGPYGESKIAAENYIIEKFAPEALKRPFHNFTDEDAVVDGKKVYIMRPCMIHGPGNKGNLNLLYGVVKKGIPWPLGAFENKRTFTSIDNLCYIIEGLLTKNVESGIYNINDDEAVSTNELIDIICSAMGKKAHIWRIPRGLMEGVAKIGGALHLPLNAERLQKLTENYVSSNAKIKKALGVEQLPVRAKDGLRMTIKSFEK
jgi:nucleoside-diphosphate-sugar epimerase